MKRSWSCALVIGYSSRRTDLCRWSYVSLGSKSFATACWTEVISNLTWSFQVSIRAPARLDHELVESVGEKVEITCHDAPGLEKADATVLYEFVEGEVE